MPTIVTVELGGTGATSAADARNTLGVMANTGGTFSGAINAATANISTIETGNALTLSTGTASNGNIIFSSNGTEDMRITNTGMIGIFTTTPNSNLTIVGNVWATTGINAATINATTSNAATFISSAGINVGAQAINAYGSANLAYAQANTARTTANDAYNTANTRLSTSGGSISGDLSITGNLTVQGNATTINVSNLSVNDSIILLANGQVGDSTDIGFVGHFDRGATATHAGLIRKATQNQFYLFDNYEVEPTNNVIDVAGQNFRVGNLRLGIINANSYVTVAGLNVTDQANAAYGQANTARSDANTTFATLNTSAATQNTNIGNAYDQANSARGQANTAYGQANLAYAQANSARSDANTTFATVNTTFATINTTTATMNTATSNRVLKAGDTMTGQLNISSGGLLVTGNSNFDSGTLFVDSVNDRVGINTSTPGYRLTVAGSSGTAALSLVESGVRTWTVDAGGQSTNTFRIADITAGFARLLIDSTGNVGIGTATVGYKLDVNGIVNIAQGSYIRKAFTDNTEEFLIRGDASVWNGFISYTPSSGTSSRGFKFGAWDNAGVRNDWVTFWNGSVGIGTAAPNLDSYGNNNSVYRLNIFYSAPTGGTVDDLLRLTSKFNSVNNSASANVGSGPAIVFAGGIGDNQTRDRARIVAVYEGSNLSGLAFHVQDTADSITEKVRIRNNGNVGIGTTNPGRRFHTYINGSDIARFEGSSTFIDIDGNGNQITGSNALRFRGTTSGDPHLLITSGGNVGIGVTTPQRKLDVTGSGILASFGSQMGVNSIAGIHFGYSETPSNNDLYKKSAMVFERTDNHNQGGNASGKIHFLLHNTGSTSASGTNSAVLTLDTDGNGTLGSARVGIGTTSPAQTLHVNGNTRIDGYITNIRNNGSVSAPSTSDHSLGTRITLYDATATAWYAIGIESDTMWFNSDNQYKWYADASQTMILNSAGNLTIAGTLTENSSEAIKENISPINNALNSISRLVGVTYDRKDGSAKQRAGLIAEAVEQVLPNIVQKDQDGNPSGIQYTNLIAYLVESIKELKAEIDVLKSK